MTLGIFSCGLTTDIMAVWGTTLSFAAYWMITRLDFEVPGVPSS